MRGYRSTSPKPKSSNNVVSLKICLKIFYPILFKVYEGVTREISSSHGGEYDVHSTRQYNPEDSSEQGVPRFWSGRKAANVANKLPYLSLCFLPGHPDSA
jgi:hypothetical protein